jgi:exodeoxyribonuclease V alpha subunit
MKIEVTVKKIIYQTQHGYVVFSGELVGQTQEIICVGQTSKLQKDMIVKCVGEYIEHPTYGLQFAFQSLELSDHMNRTQISYALRHLSEKSLTYKEIDELIDHYGIELIHIIKDHQDMDHPLYDHLSKKVKKKIAHVIDMLKAQEDEETITDILIMCGLSSTMIGNINATFKEDLASIIKSDPYELLRIDGIGFKSADKVGQWFKIPNDDIRRESALIYDIVSNMTFQRGDTYVLLDDISNEFDSFQTLHSLAECLDFAIMKQYIVVENHQIYPAINYHAEVFISEFLTSSHPKLLQYQHLDQRLKEVEALMGIELDSSQIDAITSFISLGHMVLTGGPGTGKTTIVKAILKLIEMSENPRVVHCCAPTGRAAKRLSQLTSFPASTLHSLLQWNKESNTFSRNEANPLLVDILIIDEMSMIDVVLFAHTLRACPPHVKLLLIGDPNQLPSVSPGNVLLDIMDSNVMKCVSLEYIYRQKSESDILRLAHSMLQHAWLDDLRLDVKHIESSAKHVRDHVITLITKALEKGYRIEDIQVLSPMYKGVAGVDALNHVCQKIFNPHSEDKREVLIHGKIFREFDKVLQLKNRPDDHVYNGDIGIIVDVIHPFESDNQQLTLVVDYDGHFVEYQGDYLHQLTHAYALSVHKSQGSEYPIVILVAVNDYKTMLQSRLYYTGITRAANSLICVGERSAFEKAAQQESQINRVSTLKHRLMLEKSS